MLNSNKSQQQQRVKQSHQSHPCQQPIRWSSFYSNCCFHFTFSRGQFGFHAACLFVSLSLFSSFHVFHFVLLISFPDWCTSFNMSQYKLPCQNKSHCLCPLFIWDSKDSRPCRHTVDTQQTHFIFTVDTLQKHCWHTADTLHIYLHTVDTLQTHCKKTADTLQTPQAGYIQCILYYHKGNSLVILQLRVKIKSSPTKTRKK